MYVNLLQSVFEIWITYLNAEKIYVNFSNIYGGGGEGLFLLITNGTLFFLIQNNLSLHFLRKINRGSYENI